MIKHLLFLYFPGKNTIKWSSWKSTKHGVFSILKIAYETQVDDITCYNKGNMSKEEREVVFGALIHCSEMKLMKPGSIRWFLSQIGMKTIVVKDQSSFSMPNHDENERIKWSRWNSSKFGKFLVIQLKYLPKNSNEIRCVESENMTDDELEIILSALINCSENDDMRTYSISDKLLELGMDGIVMKDIKAFHYSLLGSQKTGWSEWKCRKYGTFTIIKTQFRPKDNDGIKCVAQGNTKNKKYSDLILAGLEYCMGYETMKANDICKRLKKLGINNIVIKDCDGFYEKIDSNKVMWSKWEVIAFGTYTIVIFEDKSYR